MQTTKGSYTGYITRLLCAVLAVLLCLTMSPLLMKTAKAEDEGIIESLYVGLDALYEDEDLTGETVEGATYDPETNVLTLEDMTLPYDEEDAGGIYYAGSKDLTILIKGTVVFPEGSCIWYGGDTETTGGTIRVIGDGKESSRIVQEYESEEGFASPLFDICTVDEEDDEFEPMSRSQLVISNLTINCHLCFQ